MKCILKNKKGVTLLEGLIAMGLLAMVAAGTFGVLLSVSHKSSQPDIREEMVLAVEKVNDWLQAYSQNMDSSFTANSNILCVDESPNHPLSNGGHNVNCLLPYICKQRVSDDVKTCSGAGDKQSCFVYNVEETVDTFNITGSDKVVKENFQTNTDTVTVPQRRVTFNIKCNGFSL